MELLSLDGYHIDPELEYCPSQVISIVGPSRSGSTVIKHALSLHPLVTSLAGEEEPYYKMAGNGYPWHSSDEFSLANNPAIIRSLIANELFGTPQHVAANREWLQTRHVEEPPFVRPYPIRTSHPTSVLLLKTPQNVYRRGVLEQLWPTAEITYINTCREGRAVVNGLLDGWESPDFTARKTPAGWWKFDMPPGWSFDRSLLDTCIHQYKSAVQFAEKYYADAQKISYEMFLEDWVYWCQQLWSFCGLPKYRPPAGELPVLMATDTPHPQRWKDKRPWLEDIEL